MYPDFSATDRLHDGRLRRQRWRQHGHVRLIEKPALITVDVPTTDDDDVSGIDAGSVAAIPQSAARCEHHSSEVAAPGSLRRIEISVGVDPDDDGVRMFRCEHGKGRDAGAAGVKQRLDRASTGIFRLVELLEVNLARGRVQGLAYSPSFEQIVVGELISAAVASLRDLIQGASIIAAVSPEAEQAKIFADGEILKLAIINLLENAVKFSALVGASSVWLDVTISNNELKIEVTDEGIGIQGEDMKSLLQKGTRSERVLHIDGTGTGLYLVQRAVDLHSGRISFNSVPQGGTQATVLLPLSVAKDIG